MPPWCSATPAPTQLKIPLQRRERACFAFGQRATEQRGESDYLQPGVAYKLSDLGINDTSLIQTFYLEGIRVTPTTADQEIVASVDLDGSGPTNVVLSDSVLVNVQASSAGVIVNTTPTPLSYVAGASAIVVDPNVDVTDTAGFSIASATVAVANDDDGPYTLGLSRNAPDGISAEWDNSTGTLTLSGNASAADYQAALRMVMFTGLSQASSNGVIFSVSDVDAQNGQASRTVDVLAPAGQIEGRVTEDGGGVAITAHVDADDHYGLFYGTSDGTSLTYIGRNELVDVDSDGVYALRTRKPITSVCPPMITFI